MRLKVLERCFADSRFQVIETEACVPSPLMTRVPVFTDSLTFWGVGRVKSKDLHSLPKVTMTKQWSRTCRRCLKGLFGHLCLDMSLKQLKNWAKLWKWIRTSDVGPRFHQQDMEKRFGDAYSYTLNPRAKIFARDVGRATASRCESRETRRDTSRPWAPSRLQQLKSRNCAG